MIKTSVNTYCLSEYPFPDVLDEMKKLGYSDFELVALRDDLHIDLDEWTPAMIQQEFDQRGLNLCALYPKAISTRSEEEFKNSIIYIKKAIDTAEKLDVHRIIFSPIPPRDTFDYEMLAEGCRTLADYIGDRDIVICLENHPDWPLSYPEDFRKLFSMYDNRRICITMDTGLLTSVGVDHLAFIEEFGLRIKHLHLKDHIGEQCVALGKGETPLPAIFEKLKSIGFEGYATVEMEVEDKENIKQYLKDALKYAKEVLGIENPQSALSGS